MHKSRIYISNELKFLSKQSYLKPFFYSRSQQSVHNCKIVCLPILETSKLTHSRVNSATRLWNKENYTHFSFLLLLHKLESAMQLTFRVVKVARYVCGLFNWLTDPIACIAAGLVTQGKDIRELRLLGYQSKGTVQCVLPFSSGD